MDGEHWFVSNAGSIGRKEILDHAFNVRYLIFENGGMATKSAVEDVLMNIYPFLPRDSAHSLMNYIESNNQSCISQVARRERLPTLEEYAPYMTDVRIPFFDGRNCKGDLPT